jgi:PmbA protein
MDRLLEKARQAGAEGADAMVYDARSMSTSFRLGALENVDRSEMQDLGLRVFIGQQQANVSSNDLTEAAIDPLVERAVAMARLAPEDPYCGMAPADLLATEFPDLELEDPREPSSEDLVEMSKSAEDAGRAVRGVTNSLGAGAGWGRAEVVLATSNGFRGTYASTSQSVSCSVLAGAGDAMERDYAYSSSRHRSDLEAAQDVGHKAGERAVRKLSPRKVASQQVPIVYDPRVAAGLIGHFSGAINGASVARGTSFLKDLMGKSIFADHINITDDPHRVRGLASKAFDGEGVANRKQKLIENGVLTTWLLNTASAKQLGLTPSGHAVRGTGGPPGASTTNLYLEPGEASPEELISDISKGFYVTELIGSGINGVTGDYSRGAGGFWIENGEILYPVSEVTIAGNLKDMFLNLTPANDLEFKYGTNSPTVRVEGMTLAGA